MRLARIFLAGICLSMVVGCGKKEPLDWSEQTYEQHLEHWQSQARYELMKECTNSVTGLRQVIEFNINDSDRSVSKWDASASVEYINHEGGVDRTLAFFKFSQWQDKLICARDRALEYELFTSRARTNTLK